MKAIRIVHYHLFLASPGDLAAERQTVRDFIAAHNRNFAHSRGYQIDVLDWEHCTVPGVGRPQDLITRQTLLRYGDPLALVVGLLGQRFGAATGAY